MSSDHRPGGYIQHASGLVVRSYDLGWSFERFPGLTKFIYHTLTYINSTNNLPLLHEYNIYYNTWQISSVRIANDFLVQIL